MNALRKLARKPAYYFIFPIAVAALFSASIIQSVCPVCGGAGSLVYSVGMENVRIVSFEPRIISTRQDACSANILTLASPSVTLSNSGPVDASGYLFVHLIDLKKDVTLSSQHMAVKVPASSMTIIDGELGFFYYTGDVPPEDLDIKAEVLVTDVPCIACGGSGRSSLSSAVVLRSYRDSLVNTVRSSSEYAPTDWEIINGHRVQIGSREWLDYMELS